MKIGTKDAVQLSRLWITVSICIALLVVGCDGDSIDTGFDATSAQKATQSVTQSPRDEPPSSADQDSQFQPQTPVPEDLDPIQEPSSPSDPISPSTESKSPESAESDQDPESDDGDFGTTIDNRIPTGQFAAVGDWSIRVVGVTPDATKLILDENQFNDPPLEGNQYFIAELEATYEGDSLDRFSSRHSADAVGDSRVVYGQFETRCGVIPNPIDQAAHAYTLGTVRGNVCWEIESGDADSLMLIVIPNWDLNAKKYFFELAAPGEIEAAPVPTPIGELNPPEGVEAGLSPLVPILAGRFSAVGDWQIRVVDVTPDATEIVLAENQFNDLPAEGNQFYLVELQATYQGQTAASFSIDHESSVVGNLRVAYDEYQSRCGVIPNDIDYQPIAFNQGTVQGNVCWEVKSEEADSLILEVDSQSDIVKQFVYFELDVPESLDAPLPTSPLSELSFYGDRPGDSPQSSIPFGDSALIGNWLVMVTNVQLDATSIVYAENQFNDAPAAGNQFALVSLEASFEGQESEIFGSEFEWRAAGDSRLAYGQFGQSCGVIPNPIRDRDEAYSGGTINGNVCFEINSQDAESLQLILDSDFAFASGNEVYFALA